MSTVARSRPAPDIAIEPIDDESVEEVANLLYDRNRTIRDYTRWKYARDGFRGVIARSDGRAVGCFGIVRRELSGAGPLSVPCGWFADWYVEAGARAKGVGAEMLRDLSRYLPIVFGHPGTPAAQALCAQNGYRPVAFQSRRRLVLRRWEYERRRASRATVAAARVVIGYRKSVAAMSPVGADIPSSSSRATFLHDDSYRAWIAAQPVAAGFSRSVAAWPDQSGPIVYADDVLRTGERRRLVLHAQRSVVRDRDAWRGMARDAAMKGCAYLDCFTTDRSLDHTLARIGAWQLADSAVVVTGLPPEMNSVSLHGWDRENWTYLASEADVG